MHGQAILECIRTLMTQPLVVPDWLLDVLLGYGDPSAAAYWSLPADQQVSSYDFFDTFLDLVHVADAFPHATVRLNRELAQGEPPPPPPYRLTIPSAVARPSASRTQIDDAAVQPYIIVEPYSALAAGPYPEDAPRMNPIRFTAMQVEALRAAMNPGLSVVIGPPGTGKTDTAVQMVSNLCHTFPGQRTLVITHSNQVRRAIPHHQSG